MTARRDRRSGRTAAIWHVLVGPPLRARDVSREQITPVEGPAPRSGQTVLSQVVAMAVGRNGACYLMSLTIVVVLALAANTSFGGLPVLASLLAQNNYLPHLCALRDDRQVFASGIWTLAILSGALLVAAGWSQSAATRVASTGSRAPEKISRPNQPA